MSKTNPLADALGRHFGAPDELNDDARQQISKAAQVLDTACDVVYTKRWVNRMPINVKETCALLAIKSASRICSRNGQGNADSDNSFRLAYAAMLPVIDSDIRRGQSAAPLTGWNDTPGRTAEEIVTLMSGASRSLYNFLAGKA